MSQALNLFDDMPEAPKPTRVQTLSHYTTLEGLRKIMETNLLWASNILYLNDREEFVHGTSIARRIFLELTGKENRPFRMSDEEYERLLETSPDIFACCFCEQPDLLSQWRGYGSSTQSVSIQFTRDGLRRLASTVEVNSP